MPSESQTDFSGWLNTRLPPHLIGVNQLTELTNADLSHGDIRGELSSTTGGESSFYYEAASKWVSGAGFTSDITIIDWPYSSNASTATTISSDTNYFTGSPVAGIGSGRTITIGSGVTVAFYAKTSGIEGANSFVEYNNDLYISRSQFTVTASATADSTTFNTGDHTYKFLPGDEVFNTTYFNEGTFVTQVNTAASTVTVSSPAIANASSQSFVIKPIIARFLDGNTLESFRAGVNRPDPGIEFGQITGQERTSTSGAGHSAGWYSTTAPIPFQYGVSSFDKTGVESRISPLTDSNVGTVGGAKFPIGTGDNDDPQAIDINDVIRSSSSDSNDSDGRYALYRVGGTSAVIKRVDNLYMDSSLTVSTSVSTNDLTVAIGSARDNLQFKVKWYVYNKNSSTTGTAYKYTNSSTGYNNPFDGTTRAYTGETEYLNPSSGSVNFVLDGTTNDHYVDLFVYTKIPGETVPREYVCSALNHHGGIVSNANSKDYIDFQRADALIDIQPIEKEISPEKGLAGLIESSNLFYAFKENQLFISDYGNPNSWPSSAALNFDQNITGLGTLGSELVVFSEYGLYRVFGTDPDFLKKVEIPTTDGVKSGANNTITKFQGGLIYASLNGICFYNGQGINRITQNLLSSFSLPNATASNNHGGYYNDVYYLLGSSGQGYKIDLKSGVKLSRTDLNAGNLFFRASDNTLYSDVGRVGIPTGTKSNYTITTRKFVGGDINLEKIFLSVRLTAQDFSGTINVLVDGTQTDTFSVSGTVTDLDRTFYLAQPRQGNGIQVQLSNCTGETNKIIVNYEISPAITESLFDSVKIKYVGTPTVKVSLDNTEKISATALNQPSGALGEATLYFPSMSRGLVPHLVETQNETSGRVITFQYNSAAV